MFKVDTATANVNDTYKMTVVRDVNDYYVFLNGVLMARYVTDDYAESAFGFVCASTIDTPDVAFTNVKYSVREEVVDAILSVQDTESCLGGSFTNVNGTTYQSYGNFTMTSHNSGTLNGVPAYLYASGVTGNAYYQEVTFDNYINSYWIGIISNTSDTGLLYEEDKDAVSTWYGYGLGYGNIFRHSKDPWWNGTALQSITAPTGAYTLAVVRFNNVYYVLLNGSVIYSETFTGSKADDSPLAADNISGVGIFLGTNGKDSDVTKFSNYYCTTDSDEISAKLPETMWASFSNTNVALTATQFGDVVNTQRLIAGLETTLEFDIPANKVISELTFTENGVKTLLECIDGTYRFIPKAGATYSLNVTFADQGTATVNVTVVANENTVGGVSYALYDNLGLNTSNVKATLYNYTTGEGTLLTLSDQLTTTFTGVNSGYYGLTVEHADNVYTTYISLQNGQTANLKGYVSPVYLGGSVVVEGNTHKSYNDAEVGATGGSGWALVDGKRDTAAIKNYTYVLQNQKTGTQYYVEGTFNSTVKAKMARTFAGLLVSHGPTSLNDDTGDSKFMVAIYGKSIIICSTQKVSGAYTDLYTDPNAIGTHQAWNAANTCILANYDTVIGDYDPNAVKLGVVRDGVNYHFFVNDVYITSYYYGNITNTSGFGLAAINSAQTVIANFNYSFNTTYINALKAQAPTQNKQIDIYIIAGQSNGAGFTRVDNESGLDQRLTYGVPNVWYAGNGINVNGTSSSDKYGYVYDNSLSWGLARLGQGQRVWKDKNGIDKLYMGAEAGMALELSKYYNTASGKTAGIIKYASGGTSLRNDSSGQNMYGNWVPPTYATKATGDGGLGMTQNAYNSHDVTGALYRRMLAQVKENVRQLQQMGYTQINIKGLFWMQGEADMWGTAVNEYKKIFPIFVNDVRRDLGAITGENLSSMPFILGEISRTFSSYESSAQCQVFINAQRELAAQTGSYTVNSSQYDINAKGGVVLGTDKYHWNQTDMLSIGKLVGRCIRTNILHDV